MIIKSAPLNIVVAGYIVRGPLGGLVWHHLQYVAGLQKMGHNVLFIEDSGDYPSCYNPSNHTVTFNADYGLRFIEKVFTDNGLKNRWAYFDWNTNTWTGLSVQLINDFISKADVLLNLSGANTLREWTLQIPVRVFIDTDPVFTQVKHLQDAEAMKSAKQHNCFFSYGENFGKENCYIPDDGFAWKPTRQPVVTNFWKMIPGNKTGKWTTVMQWDSYKPATYNGISYGMKSVSFNNYFNLPQKINEHFELAIGNTTAPRKELLSNGWHVKESLSVTVTPDCYQQYIQQSKGEWSVAKDGYASTNSGWFSERSTCYLSSGRPVVVQETGFSDCIETGKGLFSFTSPEEAIEAIKEINTDYSAHCLYAKDIAEEYFRFDKVLNLLLSSLT